MPRTRETHSKSCCFFRRLHCGMALNAFSEKSFSFQIVSELNCTVKWGLKRVDHESRLFSNAITQKLLLVSSLSLGLLNAHQNSINILQFFDIRWLLMKYTANTKTYACHSKIALLSNRITMRITMRIIISLKRTYSQVFVKLSHRLYQRNLLW